MFRSLFAGVLLLCACSLLSAQEPAGVRQLAVDVVYVESVAEVEALYLKLIGPLRQGDLLGFSAFGKRPDGTPVCLIVALRPTADRWYDRRTAVLGHELRHCLGEEHGEDQTR